MVKRPGILLISLLTFAPLARSQVDVAEPNRLAVSYDLPVNATVEKLAVTFQNIQTWWSGEHSYTGDPTNFFFDGVDKACFCERLPQGGLVRHMNVVYFDPARKIRMTGGLGPLQTLPVNGVFEFNFIAAEKGQSRLQVSYAVTTNGGLLKDWAEGVERVIGEQLQRLKTEAEKA